MSGIISTLVCLSPLLFIVFGYYIGRFGSPLVFRRPRDRRAQRGELDDLDALDDRDP